MNFAGLEKRAHEIIGYARQNGKNVLEMTDNEWLMYRNVGQTTLDAIKVVIEKMRKGRYSDAMTLRDTFALAMAPTVLECLMRQPGNTTENGTYLDDITEGNSDGSSIAIAAYAIADAMLKVREEKEERRYEQTDGHDEDSGGR